MVMEVLSKLLEKAVDLGHIRLHASCFTPRITHLLFADDLLVFSDGSRHSISGVKAVMTGFKEWSGLDMNAAKSEIFFGGFSDIETAVISDITGFKVGTFPTRYLGLPLNPKKISFTTLQLFLECISCKLNSWTVKSLSFVEKITLVSSVIYGIVNFWSSVFSLPKKFYNRVDSICASFLWKNKTTAGSGARVMGLSGVDHLLLWDWNAVENLIRFLVIFYNSTLAVSVSSKVNALKCYGEIVMIERNLTGLANSLDLELKWKA
ncbi:uncharacterized protein LOC103844475 [Brassica rapa]|uniref:uncharacterized protein LOC103844475 n=1 Tax=Brassica campestris TaxID=3711 RepID=UPI0004F195A8|nr:uncharacterized protein LOC103844475 [Brassica rapa]